MKTLFISLFLLTSVMTNTMSQDTEKMTATFDFYEDGTFYFVDADGYSIAFSHMSEEPKMAYDLTKEEFVGKNFLITYTSETEMDESDEEIAVTTIVALKILD